MIEIELRTTRKLNKPMFFSYSASNGLSEVYSCQSVDEECPVVGDGLNTRTVHATYRNACQDVLSEDI